MDRGGRPDLRPGALARPRRKPPRPFGLDGHGPEGAIVFELERDRKDTVGMTGQRPQRRLAAILAADVAGYSRLMGDDEEGTLAACAAFPAPTTTTS